MAQVDWQGLGEESETLSWEDEQRREAERALARERKRERMAIEKREPIRLKMVDYERGMGVLLPIFSLPSPHGIGTFGKAAYDFLDFLSAAGAHYWQILPLHPTGFGDSPYSGTSSWAGNPLFIDLDQLAEEGLLEPSDFTELEEALAREKEKQVNALLQAESEGSPKAKEYEQDAVNYAILHQLRPALLHRAFLRGKDREQEERRHFIRRNRFWLTDYALYTIIKKEQNGKIWREWPRELRLRDPKALVAYQRAHEEEVQYIFWEQFKFYQQWERLKAAANARAIWIIGDIPIYVAYDSADVWANSRSFQLDGVLRPKALGGAPPDYFNEDGQLWGNPLYNWTYLKKEGYTFWISRLAHSMRLYNVIRLDHFIGFARYWSVPAGETTARNGKWRKGPGMAFFQAAERALGPLPILVEDLGVIEESVIRLRRQTGFPGMRPIEFAFGDEDSEYLPHNYVPRTSTYTSTHDSDTLKGWWDEVATDAEKAKMIRYFGLDAEEGMLWGILRGVCSSVADLCIFSLQDLLMLGNEARINRPGTVGENWKWRWKPDGEEWKLAQRIRTMVTRYGRI